MKHSCVSETAMSPGAQVAAVVHYGMGGGTYGSCSVSRTRQETPHTALPAWHPGLQDTWDVEWLI